MLEVRALGSIGSDPTPPLFRNLAFSLAAGESLAIVGPAASGKSVLLRILAGAIREYAGEVLFEGVELRKWSRDFFARTGAVLDPPGLYPQLTVRENVESHSRLYAGAEASADGWLERCGLAAQAGIRAVKLTTDQELLAGLARAQMHHPRLLCIDTPAEGLGPDAVERVATVIRDRKAGGFATVLATGAAAWGAACCDRTLRLGPAEDVA